MSVTTLVETVGASNANTYVTLVEADQYFEDRLNTSDWTGSSDDDKNRSLLTATKDIDNVKFIGNKLNTGKPGASNYQALDFPRRFPIDFIYQDSVLEQLLISSASEQTFPPTYNSSGAGYIPQRIKDAQCEQAIYLLSVGTEETKRANLQAQGVVAFRLGHLYERYGEGSQIVCANALILLGEFIDDSIILRRG